MKQLLIVPLVFTLAASNVHLVSADDAKPQAPGVKQSSEKMSKVVAGQQLKYLLYHPKTRAGDAAPKPGPGWPMVLFLHGAGERGNNLEKVKVHGPPKLIASNALLQGCVVISPQCPARSWWNTETLKALVDEVLKANPDIDKNRLYITGLSMGGYGTWGFISEYPGLFAAAVPICGGGDPGRLKIDLQTAFPKNFSLKKLTAAKDLPIRVYHGGSDNVVPEGESELLVEALKKAGKTKVDYTVYPKVGHNSWTRTYADGDLWKWLLAQKRVKK